MVDSAFAFFPEHEPEQWQQHQATGAAAFRNVGRRVARRLPEPGQHAARARRGAAEGNRDPARARRQSLADRAAIAHRRFRPRAGRRSLRVAPGSLVVRSARGLVRQETADRHRLAERPERAGARGDICLLSARDVRLRARAGVEVVEIRGHRRFEGTRGRRHGRQALEVFAAQSAGRRADRVFARAAHGGRALHSRRGQGGGGRYRFADEIELPLGSRRESRDLRSDALAGSVSNARGTARGLARRRARQHLLHGPVRDGIDSTNRCNAAERIRRRTRSPPPPRKVSRSLRTGTAWARIISRPSACRCCAAALSTWRKRCIKLRRGWPSSTKCWRKSFGPTATRSASRFNLRKRIRRGQERWRARRERRSRSSASCLTRAAICSRKIRAARSISRLPAVSRATFSFTSNSRPTPAAIPSRPRI